MALKNIQFVVIACGMPVLLVGGALLIKRHSDEAEISHSIQTAKSHGLTADRSDVDKLQVPDDDNAMTPLNTYWAKNGRDKVLAWKQSSPKYKIPIEETQPLLDALKEGAVRKKAWRAPGVWPDDTDIIPITMDILFKRAKTWAATNPEVARDTFVACDKFCRVIAASKAPDLAAQGVFWHGQMMKAVMIASYYAAPHPVADIKALTARPAGRMTYAQDVRSYSGFVITKMDQVADLAADPNPSIPYFNPEMRAAFKDEVVLRKTKALMLDYFDELARLPPTAGITLPDKLMASADKIGPKAHNIVQMMQWLCKLACFEFRSPWNGYEMPVDLAPWFLAACKAGIKSPPGLEGFKDMAGDAVHFKTIPGGLAIYTLGKDGIEANWSKGDDRWIRVQDTGGTLNEKIAAFRDPIAEKQTNLGDYVYETKH